MEALQDEGSRGVVLDADDLRTEIAHVHLANGLFYTLAETSIPSKLALDDVSFNGLISAVKAQRTYSHEVPKAPRICSTSPVPT